MGDFVSVSVGVGIGMLILHIAKIMLSDRKNKVGTPSPSHDTGSPKLPATCKECVLYHICCFGTTLGDDECIKARSQLRASATNSHTEV